MNCQGATTSFERVAIWLMRSFSCGSEASLPVHSAATTTNVTVTVPAVVAIIDHRGVNVHVQDVAYVLYPHEPFCGVRHVELELRGYTKKSAGVRSMACTQMPNNEHS